MNIEKNIKSMLFLLNAFFIFITEALIYAIFRDYSFFIDRLSIRLASINMLYVKIFQAFALNNSLIDDKTNNNLLKFTDNAPWTYSDIDLYQLIEMSDKFNLQLLRGYEKPINAGMISLVFMGYDNKNLNKQVIIKMKRKNIQKKLDEAIDNLLFSIYILSFIPIINKYQLSEVVNKNVEIIRHQTNFLEEIDNMDRIKALYEDEKNDFIILENKCSLSYLQNRIERYNFDRMKLYSLMDTSNEKLINYFKLMYLSVSDYEIIQVDIQKPVFNTPFSTRFDIINKLTKASDKYLEIGVEYGECFNGTHFLHKTGVDPDPKFVPSQNQTLCKLTSDDYFQHLFITDLERTTKFNAIFIDGMHQVEYIIKDINNSLKVLADDGLIFVDDILPFNYNEQLKIPIKHYYENGILKYGENWTGDIWKVVYWMLLHCKDSIVKFEYYYNVHFRGIGVFKFNEIVEITDDAVDIINGYDYFKDYACYIKELQTFSN